MVSSLLGRYRAVALKRPALVARAPDASTGVEARSPQVLAAELLAIAERCDGELPALQGAARRARAALTAARGAHGDVRRELRRRVADAEADVAAARSGVVEARRWRDEVLAREPLA